jgi:hypothetical protein
VKQGEGYAIELDGTDDYVDCTASKRHGLSGPVGIAAWVKPTRKAEGEAHLLGEGMGSFSVSYYNTQLCHFYLGSGGNHLKDYLTLDKWQHIAVSFDGDRMKMWLDGRVVGGRESETKTISPVGTFSIGSKGPPDMPRFKGLIDNVRLYNRGLTDDEVLELVTSEAQDHDLGVTVASPETEEATLQFFHEHPNPIDHREIDNRVLFANEHLGIEFFKSNTGFQLSRLYDIENRHDFLALGSAVGFNDIFQLMITRDPRGSGKDRRWEVKPSLMGIMEEMAEDAFPVGANAAESVEWNVEEDAGESRLRLAWNRIGVKDELGVLDVEVTITLRAGDPLSRWHFAIKNRSYVWGIERVRFPVLPLAAIGEEKDNVFLYPRERGGFVEDPFHATTGMGASLNTRGAFYPVDFNMQFQALYGASKGHGIYLATHDPGAHLKHIQIANTPASVTWKPAHFPPNITFAEEDYDMPYDCVIGPFQGDWYDACMIYRDWALQQPWASKGPLKHRKDTPKWFKESPLMFYTVVADSAEGTHSIDENILIAKNHFKEMVEWAGVPLTANWYNWKHYHPGQTTYDVPFGSHRLYNQGRWRNLPCMNIHDGNYPVIGAHPGTAEAIRSMRDVGGMACPYVALEIFDQGPSENSPFAAEAKPNMVRDLYGVIRTWGAETSWQACVATDWWRRRLRETCVELVRREGVPGFYLDVMQGAGLPCYWTPHGHSAAGGDSMTRGMHELVEIIREGIKEEDPDVIITGENCTENMIDVIDGTLQVTLWQENRASLFASVYQDYLVRYGTEVSTGVGYKGRFAKEYDDDAFFIECAAMFVDGTQIGRLRLKPRDNSLSLDKPAQKPMFDFLARVVDYYKNPTTREFLAYGRLVRPLKFEVRGDMPMLEYAKGWTVPALSSGVFLSEAGELCVFVVNASRDELAWSASLDPARHELPEAPLLQVEEIGFGGTVEKFGKSARGVLTLKHQTAGRGIAVFHIAAR